MDDTSQHKNRRRVWLIAIVLGMLLFIVGLTFFLDRQPTQETSQSVDSTEHTDVAIEFMRALTRPDGSRSYYLMSVGARKDVGERTKWINDLEKTFAHKVLRFSLQGISEVNSSDTENKPLRYTYAIDFKDGTSQNITIVVKNVDGSLVVDEYNARPLDPTN